TDSTFDISVSLSLHEIAPHVRQAGFGSFCGNELVINAQLFDSLPDDIKQVIEEVTSEFLPVVMDVQAQADAEVCDTYKQAGGSVGVWSDEEKARWRDEAADDVLAEWRKSAETAGAPAEEFHERFRATLDRYEAEHADYRPGVEVCAESF